MPRLATPPSSRPPRPRPRAPRGRTSTAIARTLRVLGTAALLGVGLAVALLVTANRDDGLGALLINARLESVAAKRVFGRLLEWWDNRRLRFEFA